jgi:diadenosine tetraphosphate (Ap4A) HIT family hydrolase
MGKHSSDAPLLPDGEPDWLAYARSGDNPLAMAKLPSGYVVYGDTQFLPGYCVLLSDVDDADHLTDLPLPQQQQFLADMALVGQAIYNACSGYDPAFRRVNYEILGNLYEHLHAHITARYSWEPAEFRAGPVARYPLEQRKAEEYDTIKSERAEEFDALRDAITAEINRLCARSL